MQATPTNKIYQVIFEEGRDRYYTWSQIFLEASSPEDCWKKVCTLADQNGLYELIHQSYGLNRRSNYYQFQSDEFGSHRIPFETVLKIEKQLLLEQVQKKQREFYFGLVPYIEKEGLVRDRTLGGFLFDMINDGVHQDNPDFYNADRFRNIRFDSNYHNSEPIVTMSEMKLAQFGKISEIVAA